MLKRSKDKILEITNEKNTIERDFDVLQKSSTEKINALENKLKIVQAEMSYAKEEIDILKQREEESVISLAQNKLSIHKELEEKEDQIKKLRSELKQSLGQEKIFKEAMDTLQQELEKAKLLVKEHKETNEDHSSKDQLLKEMQQKIIELESEMSLKSNEEANKNNELLVKIDELENQCKALQCVSNEEKNRSILELNSKKVEYEQIIEEHKCQNVNLTKELLETKKLLEKIQNENATVVNNLKDTSEKELNTLKQALLDKNSNCEHLNAKIRDYTEALEQFNNKLQMQEEEIRILRSKTAKEEKIATLQEDLEFKNAEILRLSNELNLSSNTASNLKTEINSLIDYKNNFYKCLKMYKNTIECLRQDCAAIKCNVNNVISDEQGAIKGIIITTTKALSLINERNIILQTQLNETVAELKIMKELQNDFKDNNLQLEKLLCDKVQLEKELKEKNNELVEIKNQLNKIHELENSNKLSISEIKSLNKRQNTIQDGRKR